MEQNSKKKMVAIFAAITFLVVLVLSFYVENLQYNNGFCFICGRKYTIHEGSDVVGNYYECPECNFVMNYGK